MRSKAALAVALLALSGCALIKNGSSQRVKFESDPPKAEVWLNGERHPDLTPTTIELPRKEVSYQIKKQGYDTVASKLTTRTSSYFYWSFLGGVITTALDWLTGSWQEFDLPEEAKETIKVTLEPSIDNTDHVVAFSSNPPGASIKIDGLEVHEKKTGVHGRGTRINVNWKSPSDQVRRIELIHPGGLHEVASLELRRGQKEVKKDLDPKPITQTIAFESDPPGAQVFVDTVPVTTTPGSTKYDRRPGDEPVKKVEFRLAGYHSKFETVEGKADKKFSVKLIETIETVSLKVDCAPLGSAIEIDGKPAGETPAEVRLPWSVTLKSHKLKFSRPGYESRELVIDSSQKSEPVTVRLKPSLPEFP